MNRRILSILAVVTGLLLLSVHHLGHSFGDDLFRWAGIAPWTNPEANSGAHLPAIVGIILLVLGIVGVSHLYRERDPKVKSRVILGCIAFMMVFPFASEGGMFLLKSNASGLSSVSYAKKDSRCSYRTEDGKVLAECWLNIYNYGKEQQVTIRPLDTQVGDSVIAYESKSVTVQPRRQNRAFVVFEGDAKPALDSYHGMRQEPGMEIEVGGRSKQIQ